MSSTPEKIDKYVVLGELGRGAMGTVYKARDPVLDRLVAIKMMSEELLIEEEMRGRFNREAKSAAGLQHPNIVTIFDFGELENEGTPYIVMELLDGVSLAQMMEEGQPERLEDKVQIVTQICRGLDYAHKRGLIHRDIKPGNIQVLPAGTAKVLDFGIALGEGSSIKTKTGLVMGTPNYMAPEQISGEKKSTFVSTCGPSASSSTNFCRVRDPLWPRPYRVSCIGSCTPRRSFSMLVLSDFPRSSSPSSSVF